MYIIKHSYSQSEMSILTKKLNYVFLWSQIGLQFTIKRHKLSQGRVEIPDFKVSGGATADVFHSCLPEKHFCPGQVIVL